MELRHLRYFTAVADELNFGRAARRLNISQPPLSQQIHDLEDELGVKLFHRTKRRVELTEAGRVFLGEAQLTLAQAAQALKAAQRANRGEIGRLVIGFVMSATCSVLPAILLAFRERYPGVELVLEESTTGKAMVDLSEGRIQIGFLRLPVIGKALSFWPVLHEPLVAALPEGHPLAKKLKVSLRELAHEPFVLFPRQHGSGFYDQIVSVCHGCGFSPRVTQEATQMQTILSLVAAGLGVSVIPASVQSLRNDGVVYRSLRERTPETGITIAWRSEDQSPVVAGFLRVARAQTRGQVRALEA